MDQLSDLPLGAYPWVAIGVTLFVLSIIWGVPKWQAARFRAAYPSTDGKGLFEIENEARRTLAQAIGGSVVLITLALTWRQVVGVEDGRITDRYTSAVDQLDATKSMGVRLGGIFALERIANEADSYRQPIREVLAGFVRTNACWDENPNAFPCPDSAGLSQEAAAIGTPPPTLAAASPPEDVIAAVRVIARLSAEDTVAGPCLSLANTRLPWIDLTSATLTNICFDGADLRHAVFSNADLDRASLRAASLEQAQFTGASGTETRFDRATLTDAVMTGGTFHLASFEGAILDRTNVKRTAFQDDARAQETASVGLEEDQLKRACLDQNTVLPFYLSHEQVRPYNTEQYCSH